MDLTEEMIFACGFKKGKGHGTDYYYRLVDGQLMLHNNATGRYVYKMPNTLEKLLYIVRDYYKIIYCAEGYSSAQSSIREALGIKEFE